MKVLFVAARLSNEDRKRLLEVVPPRHTRVYAEHMTIVFKPNGGHWAMGLLGQQARLVVDNEYCTTGVQCIGLVSARSENTYPHITISCAEGAEPKLCNALLANSEAQHRPVGGLEFYATIEAQVATKAGIRWVTSLEEVAP